MLNTLRPVRPLAVLVLLGSIFHTGTAEAAALRGDALSAVDLAAGPAACSAADPAARSAANPATSSPAGGRVIVLGFDGADARTTQALMDAGQLPNLARLRAAGTFAPLGSTVPPESPVSWAALNCGQNPAKTGIPGFIVRKNAPDSAPLPDFGFLRHEPRATTALEPGFLQAILVRHEPWVLGASFGALAFLGFLFVFAYLLKIRMRVALPLALVLGGIGAYGAAAASRCVPREIADVVANLTETSAFYEDAARAGVPTVVIDAGMSWDRPAVPNLKLLAGLGVPDVRAQYGDWFVYTTDAKVFDRAPSFHPTSTGGREFRVDENEGKIDSFVYGPMNYLRLDACRREAAAIDERLGRAGLSDTEVERLQARRAEIVSEESRLRATDTEAGRVSVPLHVEKRGNRQALVAIGEHEQLLTEGSWSNWYHLTFELSPLVKAKAITRAKLVHLDEPFELYVDFLQIDPADPLFWQPVSQPAGFAHELANAMEASYETIGWACMTMPFKDRRIDPRTFLEDMQFTHECRAKLLAAALASQEYRLFFDVESTPDRVQHMCYQFYDEKHPSYDAGKAATKIQYFGEEIALAEAIPATYRALDRYVGEVMTKHLRPEDTLIVCADHGFQPFRRQISLNAWLMREGYLVPRADLQPGSSPALLYVDWSRTRAYALGLGTIYLNLEGRERDGIVSAADAPKLLAEIRAKLLALEDPVVHAKAVREVYDLAQIHSGPHLGRQGDLMLGCEAGWRVSWSTTTGDLTFAASEDGQGPTPPEVFSDNRSNWSGDHVSVAEDLVRGIFFCNRKVEIPKEGVNLLHIAPTVLELLGVPIPKAYDVPALRVER